MIEQGYFSLIRWRPDLVRDECRNLGVALVDQEGEWAGVRHVAPSSLPEAIGQQGIVYDLLVAMEERARGNGALTRTDLEGMSRAFSTYLVITEPQPVAVLDGDFAASLEALWKDYAQPPGRPVAPKLKAVFAQRFRPLIKSGRLQMDYLLASGSGAPRRVDFFANSGANVAFDALRLSLKQGDEIMRRADAEAFKIEDIRRGSPDVRFVVYCEFSSGTAPPTGEVVAKVLQSVGAEVTWEVDEAVQRMKRVMGALAA